jgi:hypothetical protein
MGRGGTSHAFVDTFPNSETDRGSIGGIPATGASGYVICAGEGAAATASYGTDEQSDSSDSSALVKGNDATNSDENACSADQGTNHHPNRGFATGTNTKPWTDKTAIGEVETIELAGRP